MTTRREFIGSATNAAALAVLPASFLEKLPEEARPMRENIEWNVAWAENLKGKHRAVFDMTEVESGLGVFRAAFWSNQYTDVMKAAPTDLTPVLILRHNAVILALQQSFWDKYNIGELKEVTNPMTDEPTKKNPVLMDERDGVPASLASMALHKQIARGAVVLACNLALRQYADMIRRNEGVSQEEAQKQAAGYLVPGVILQPSGVFAAVRAQQAGAVYVKAS